MFLCSSLNKSKMPSCQALPLVALTQVENAWKHSYFHFPNPVREKAQVAERWLVNIGTGYTINTFKFSKDKVVCCDHFYVNCLELDRPAQLLGYTPHKSETRIHNFGLRSMLEDCLYHTDKM